MSSQTYSSEANGTRKNAAESVSAKQAAAAAATSDDVQDDVQTLKQDIARLSQQLAGLVAAKGTEAWSLAKDNIDGMLSEAGSKGKEAADAVGEVRDNLAAAIEDSIENRPYTTLALTLAAGFIVGAMWKR